MRSIKTSLAKLQKLGIPFDKKLLSEKVTQDTINKINKIIADRENLHSFSNKIAKE